MPCVVGRKIDYRGAKEYVQGGTVTEEAHVSVTLQIFLRYNTSCIGRDRRFDGNRGAHENEVTLEDIRTFEEINGTFLRNKAVIGGPKFALNNTNTPWMNKTSMCTGHANLMDLGIFSHLGTTIHLFWVNILAAFTMTMSPVKAAGDGVVF